MVGRPKKLYTLYGNGQVTGLVPLGAL